MGRGHGARVRGGSSGRWPGVKIRLEARAELKLEAGSVHVFSAYAQVLTGCGAVALGATWLAGAGAALEVAGCLVEAQGALAALGGVVAIRAGWAWAIESAAGRGFA